MVDSKLGRKMKGELHILLLQTASHIGESSPLLSDAGIEVRKNVDLPTVMSKLPFVDNPPVPGSLLVPVIVEPNNEDPRL